MTFRCKKLLMLAVVLVIVLFAVKPLPAAYRITLQPSISVSEEYTNNFDLTEEDKESEWITTISPSLALNVLGKTEGLNLNYTPGFSLYAKNEEDSTIRHSASLGAWKQLSKHLRLSIDNSYTRTEEPYETVTIPLSPEEVQGLEPEDYTIRRDRDPHSSYNGRLNLDYQFGKKDNLGFSYRFRRTWDENPGIEDSIEHSPEANLSYWLTPHWGTEYSVGYTRGEFTEDTDTFDEWTLGYKLIHNFNRFWDGFFEYKHTFMNYQGETEDYQVFDPSLGINWRFAKDGSLSLSLGYYVQDKEDSDNESNLSVSGDLSKGFDISRRTSFRITGGSGYEQSYFGAENLGFTVYYEGQGRLTHALTKHLNSDLSVSYRRNEYKDEEPERDDNIWSFEGGLTWQFIERASLSLTDTYRVVDSNQEGEDYEENKVMLSITYTPKPYLFK